MRNEDFLQDSGNQLDRVRKIFHVFWYPDSNPSEVSVFKSGGTSINRKKMARV